MPSRLRLAGAWLALATVIAACAGEASGPSPMTRDAESRAVTTFLNTYVRPDGRVSRRDQLGDTVSEGQAYGLLLAQVAGEPAVFNRIWRWTQEHMQLPSGLFAFHANAAGQVLGAGPASDADLLIAWALLRYQGPDAALRHRAGRRVAAALLAQEVTTVPGGAPALAAGPWAVGRPASLDPSYWALPALAGLTELTGNPQWRRLASEAVALTWRLTGGGRNLPPDWAQVSTAGTLAPVPAPNGSEPEPAYGLDAQRVIVWFAVSCDPRARALAAAWWGRLRRADRAHAIALFPDGRVLDREGAPLPLIAAAAAARAAGSERASGHLLDRALRLQHRYPTYYGGAWTALGLALFDGALGGSCSG